MSRRLELFRSPDLVIRYYPRGAERCVVTFEAISVDLSLDREAFAEEFLKSRDISAIHILGRHNNWYQSEGVVAALACVADAVAQYPSVVAYGSSMGGYGALRFADEVGADLVIAISPQYSLSRERVPFETRWREAARHVRWGSVDRRPLSPRARAIVIFDPYLSPDRKHVDAIARDRPIERIAVPFSGHPSSTYLAETGVFVAVIEHLLAGKSVDHLVAPALKKRRETPVYWIALSERAFYRNKAQAVALARRGVETHPQVHYLWNQLGHFLLNVGQYREAVAAMEEALRLNGGHRITMQNYARTLAAAGRLSEARTAANTVGVSYRAILTDALLLRTEHLFRRLVGKL